MAVPLGTSPRRVYAAPGYLDRHGVPRYPNELTGHNRIGFTLLEHYDSWNFTHIAQELDVVIKGNVTSNSSEAFREMVLSGLGISLSPEWLFTADVERGRFVPYSTIIRPARCLSAPCSVVSDDVQRGRWR